MLITQGVFYADPAQRVFYAFFARFLRVFYLAQIPGLRKNQLVRCGPPQPSRNRAVWWRLWGVLRLLASVRKKGELMLES